jgi:hypothetical protein
MPPPAIRARGSISWLNRCTSVDIQAEGAQIHGASIGWHVTDAQVRKVHLTLQP